MAKFDNRMTAHVWAQERIPSGASHNGNLSFQTTRLYSYSTVIGLLLPGGRAAFTTTTYSKTTSGKHMPGLHAAIRHKESFGLPALDNIVDSLESFAKWRAGLRGKPPEHIESDLQRYLAENVAGLSDEAGTYLLALLSPRKSWAAFKARELAKAAKVRAAKAAKVKAALVREARERAAKPWPIVRAECWNQATNYRQTALRAEIAEMRAERLATPKAHKRVRAALWRMETGARAILASAERDSDRNGNPGDRTKARNLLGQLRRFKAGTFNVPGFDGPDGAAKLQAALDMPSGAGWRMLADMLRQLHKLPLHLPRAVRIKAESIYEQADAIATEREGEEKQRQEIRSARSAVMRRLMSFNQGRRFYRQLMESGGWEGATTDHTGNTMSDRQRVRALDSIISHVPESVPWGTDRGLELSPALAARAKAIAARAAEIAAELEPIRHVLLDAAERAAENARRIEREERERVAAMSPEERLEAWEAGKLTTYLVRDLEAARGPLLRALEPVLDGCAIKSGTLETSQGATVPLRHAFAVFAFVRDCRAKGLPWLPEGTERGSHARHGPKHIRVGHFQVDSISATGDFVAGCHRIKWGEVERLANRLGVFDCAPVALESADNA